MGAEKRDSIGEIFGVGLRSGYLETVTGFVVWITSCVGALKGRPYKSNS